MPEFNRRFTVSPRENESSFKKHTGPQCLKELMCIREPRKIGSGNTFSWDSERYFVNGDVNYRFRKVIVKIYPDGTTGFEIFGKAVTVTNIGKCRAYAKLKRLAA